MRLFVSKGLMLVVGLAAVPATISRAERSCARTDPRLETLDRFFEQADCPARQYSHEFLRVADEYDLDWRLLPSISWVESTGGRAARNNNYFGWKNGKSGFASVPAGIRTVARTLAESKLYRGKDLEQKLVLYNGFAHYPGVVKSVMKRIHPTEQVRSYHSSPPFIRASVRRSTARRTQALQ